MKKKLKFLFRNNTLIQAYQTGVVHADFASFLESHEERCEDVFEMLQVKVAQVAMVALTPIIYGTFGVVELFVDISTTPHPHSIRTLLKVTTVFLETLFYATLRVISSLVGIDPIRKILDNGLARNLVFLSIAKAGGVRPFLKDYTNNGFLELLPDNGVRLVNKEEALATYIASRRRGYQDFMTWDVMNDFVEDFIFQQYRYEEQLEIMAERQPELFAPLRHISDNRERAIDLVHHALREAKRGLIEEGVYDEDTIASMEPESYQAMMNRAVFEILLHTSLENDVVRISFGDLEEVNVVMLSSNDDCMNSYAALKEAYLALNNFSEENRAQLLHLLALKECEASGEVRELFQKITAIRMRWDTSFMNTNEMPSQHAARFMEIFAVS